MLKPLGRLWAPKVLPGVRKALVRGYQRYYLKAAFAKWRAASIRKFGVHREVMAHGHPLVVQSADWRGFAISRSGGTQKNLVSLWTKMARTMPDLCIDVGANYGEFSVTIADFVPRLIAIEANPAVFACLSLSLRGKNAAEARNVAATDKTGPTEIYVSDAMSGYSSLSRDVVQSMETPAGARNKAARTVVHGITIDNLVANEMKTTPRSLLMKIDVEGFEDTVIAGALRTVESAERWRAIIEFNTNGLTQRGLDPGAFWKVLREYHGVIIEPNLDDRVWQQLDSRLPEAVPIHCNVLVGRGIFSAS